MGFHFPVPKLCGHGWYQNGSSEKEELDPWEVMQKNHGFDGRKEIAVQMQLEDSETAGLSTLGGFSPSSPSTDMSENLM